MNPNSSSYSGGKGGSGGHGCHSGGQGGHGSGHGGGHGGHCGAGKGKWKKKLLLINLFNNKLFTIKKKTISFFNKLF